MCNNINNTNQITDIITLQCICKLHNFMHIIRAMKQPSHCQVLVPAGYTGRYLAHLVLPDFKKLNLVDPYLFAVKIKG